MAENEGDTPNRQYGAAEVGALAHLYRGEMYRSTVWRTRLDTTTNWSVVTNEESMAEAAEPASSEPPGSAEAGLKSSDKTEEAEESKPEAAKRTKGRTRT